MRFCKILFFIFIWTLPIYGAPQSHQAKVNHLQQLHTLLVQVKLPQGAQDIKEQLLRRLENNIATGKVAARPNSPWKIKAKKHFDILFTNGTVTQWEQKINNLCAGSANF